MIKLLLAFLVLTAMMSVVGTKAVAAEPVKIVLQTSEGRIMLQLDPDKAPETVRNFLGYVEAGHYDGTIFHRVIPGFMIQGGGFTAGFQQKPTRSPVSNEADNGLKNRRGTIAMARTMDPQSATAQFFINVADNEFLNFQNPTPRGYGYAVFGEVVEGMEVVDRIVAIPTGPAGPFPSDVPRTTVLIEKAELLKPGAEQ
ncbi:peptidylprolyl isomerase [Desulfurivibrio sp. C05AmB]|jgi:peptidyl-prolyl cis-trans isomerase B (cyclophilin B)|uniref:peptidylprolyl isomerase n=1 Tax=Desulfurivibrio sp. C05AmB TaxID=3374371 RepID=UPI00376F0C97